MTLPTPSTPISPRTREATVTPAKSTAAKGPSSPGEDAKAKAPQDAAFDAALSMVKAWRRDGEHVERLPIAIGALLLSERKEARTAVWREAEQHYGELLAVCEAIEAHCQVKTTEHGDPIAHAAEGIVLRGRMNRAIAAAIDARGRDRNE